MSVLLLSGGLDSAVLLAQIADSGGRPECMTFNYGQRHVREVACAESLAMAFGCRHTIVNAAGLFSPCPLTAGGTIPTGFRPDDAAQAATVVPNRNAVMISVAAARASTHADKAVYVGFHRGDSAVYQDCRADFVDSMSAAMTISCGCRVVAPFANTTRRDVVALGRTLMVPFNMTWSCYLGGDEPCGDCGACRSREEAMA